MRALHRGSASAFQADSAGSIPAARSNFNLKIGNKKLWALALIAQSDRASDSGSEGRGFNSR